MNDDQVKAWINLAEYDLETAKAMLDTGRYLYVTFMSQQAIEKTLKAIFVSKKGEIPPRTHNLLYLIDILQLTVSDDDKNICAQLNQFYLGHRYPGSIMDLVKAIDQQKAGFYFERAKELMGCLKQNIV